MKPGVRVYNLFPPLVGSVDQWSAELPRIAALGFDWIYLNPFHVTGYSGSLYAVHDYDRLNPLFRGEATVDDDTLLRGFVEQARAHGLSVMMDLVVNHTARDHPFTTTHPEWYKRDERGEIVSPHAIDPAEPSNVTVWTDLAELDYGDRPERTELVFAMADVVRHYAELGFRGFRCDAAYQVPGEVWRALIVAGRGVAHDVLFAAENLGAPDEAVVQLAAAGFDYLFNSSKWWDFEAPWLLELYEKYRHIAPSIAFPESHDTPRLATELATGDVAELEREYRFRYRFAAVFSTGVMMPIGYEFGARERLDVVMTRPHHREAPRFDLSPEIARVNAMRAAVPALNEEGPQQAIPLGGGAIALVRRRDGAPDLAVTLVNPADEPVEVALDALVADLGPLVDVLPDDAPIDPYASTPVTLAPRSVRVLATPLPEPSVEPPSAPARRGDARLEARPVVIERVTPSVDGRYAIKRIAGDRVVVEADIFRDGHDRIAAVVKVRERGGPWRETPMVLVENDRWRGTIRFDRNARYEYAIDAWPDAFASWRHDTQAKRDAGQAIGLELTEGCGLVEQARARAGARDRVALDLLAAQLDAAASDDERADLLLGASTRDLMARVPDRSRATTTAPFPAIVDRRAAQVGAWYEFFPRSAGRVPGVHGTFDDAIAQLPRIRTMGFDVVYLPPIHPIGRTFRKGKNNALHAVEGDPGSPWAIGNEHGGHTAVEPALGTLDDFGRFVAAAHANGIEVALDYALQCSPDHPWVREHPEWFTFRPDGSIKYAENPPKKYQDIVNFNWYGPHAPALWDALRDVVSFWIERGVRIFRVDNPHTKPFAFWAWMIDDIQSRHPEVIFLAEAFTRPKVMQQLAKLGFTQSYTYFTWRNFKGELTQYMEELAHGEMAEYYRPNFFANTPDILPPFLQTGGRPAFRIRFMLAATLAGTYGIYSGFELSENAALPDREEYADSEKYEIRVRDWDAPGNLAAEIALVNRIRREHRALHDWRNVRFLESEHDNVIFYRKSAGTDTLLIAVTLDPFRPADARLHVPLGELGLGPDDSYAIRELLSGESFLWRGAVQAWRFDPGSNPAAIFHLDRRLQVDYDTPSF